MSPWPDDDELNESEPTALGLNVATGFIALGLTAMALWLGRTVLMLVGAI